MTKTETETAPEVWVGCLGCYNAGALVGAWVDAIDAVDFDAHAAGMGPAGLTVPACGRTVADEPWVFDLEGFGPFLTGECSPSEAARVAELLEAIEADGLELEAVGAWVDWRGEPVTEWDSPTREAFEDSYAGEWDSGADYAAELADELGAFSIGAGDPYGAGDPVDISSRWPFSCIDWGRAWRELELGDGMHITDEGYVFRP